MTFQSILFENTDNYKITETLQEPAFFVDLNLDQVIDAITAGKQEYNIKPFFYISLHDIDTINYRHDIMRDLENDTLLVNIKSFEQKLHLMREYLTQADKLYYKYQKESWFLDAVGIYCEGVTCLEHDLSLTNLKSHGFLAFREYTTSYVKSDCFTSLLAETKKLKVDLSTIKYCLVIKGNRIRVRKYETEIDYGADVEDTFEKFKQGAVKDYRINFSEWVEMNHVEAEVLDLVARLYPEIFVNLDNYYAKNRDYLDETIGVFDREIQFYLAYLEFGEKLKRAGLKFCYPKISTVGKEVYDYEGFDLALAYKLVTENSSIICNDFHLREPERIIVVTGPNQGGKTTFARTFGQLHYMASIGFPVPGKDAQLFLFDKLFTHFGKVENIKNLRGKLQDDLIRMNDILNQATSSSVLIINEIFTSTTLHDAIFLGKKVLEKIIQLDLLCVCVTFVDELASYSEKTVSMVSTVVPENPTLRTFKIIRKPADGLAYAISIAEKYHLTFDCLQERIRS